MCPGDMTLADALAAVPSWLETNADALPLPVARFCSQYYPDARVRRACLRAIGVVFEDDSSFANLGLTVIPNRSLGVHVRIGRNVSIGPNVTCVCDSCANNGEEINRYRYVADKLTCRADITIQDEAWIGAGVTILPGVKVGRCAVIGAGCVLKHDADDYGVYAGVPGRKIGDVRAWGEVCDDDE